MASLKRVTANVLTLIIVLMSGYLWLEKCSGDYGVSIASKTTGISRIIALDKYRTLESKYIAAGYMAQEAVDGNGLSIKQRCIVIIAAYESLKKINKIAPGYRKVKPLYNELCKVVEVR